MKISTKIVIDMSTDQVLEHEQYEYSGPVAECKGGNSKAEMQRANQVQDQQTALMQQQLLSMRQTLAPFLAANQQVMQNTGGVIDLNNQILANGGLTPQQQQAYTAQAIDQATQGYRNAVGQINNALVARGLSGGGFAGGGGVGQQFGALGATLGGQMQNAMGGINNLKFQSFENAMNMNAGLYQNSLANQAQAAGMFEGLTGQFNQGGINALNAGVTAAHNVDQAQMAPWNMLAGVAGGALGSFLNPLAGGLSGGLMDTWGIKHSNT